MPSPTSTGGGLMGYPSTVDSGGVQDWIITSETTDFSSTSGTLVGNTVYLYAFVVRASTTISGMRIRCGTTATGTSDLGMYDSGGNLLVHTGAVTNTASTNQTNNFSTSVTLAPGQYFLAMCPSNSTDTFQKLSSMTNVSPFGNWKTATNTGTAGVLPATTGGATNGANAPMMSAVVVGGLA